MFLKLNHQKPDIYKFSQAFVLECYKLERKRFFEISRSSIVEIDAALDIANGLEYLKNYDFYKLAEEMVRSFKTLTGLIVSQKKN